MEQAIPFPAHKTSIPEHIPAQAHIFEMEFEKMRAKCTLQLSLDEANKIQPRMRDRLMTSINRSVNFLGSRIVR